VSEPIVSELDEPKVVKAVELRGFDVTPSTFGMAPLGSWVAVRPCADEYEGKTYLGISLGDLPSGLSLGYGEKDQKLVLMSRGNPAILIPSKGTVVRGYESWWGVIKTPEDLKQITDDDISNVWYVKALRERLGMEETEPEEGETV
jgi:hypothetical protein